MDDELRMLSRAAAQGDVAAEVTHLTRRIRAGELSRIDLELAAYLGHEPARVALGPSALSRGPSFGGWAQGDFTADDLARSDLVYWLRGLERWGVPVLVRGLVALGRLALPRLEAERPHAHEPRLALAATEAWCDDPGESAMVAVRASLEAAATTSSRPRAYMNVDAELGVLWKLTIEAPEVLRMAVGRNGHRFTQGARDPRRKLWLFLHLFTIDEVERGVREALLPVALAGRTLAWSESYRPPARPGPLAVEGGAPPLEPATRELAAYLGHAPSRRALGPSVLSRWPGEVGWEQGTLSAGELASSDLGAWVRGLELWGLPWLARGNWAMCVAGSSLYERELPDDATLREQLDAVRAWCDAPHCDVRPSPAALGEAEDRARSLTGEARQRAFTGIDMVRQVLRLPTLAASSGGLSGDDPRPLVCIEQTIDRLSRHGIDVVDSIRSALLPLLLGLETRPGPPDTTSDSRS